MHFVEIVLLILALMALVGIITALDMIKTACMLSEVVGYNPTGMLVLGVVTMIVSLGLLITCIYILLTTRGMA